MTNDQVRPLNYCAHAIEDLKQQQAQIRRFAPVSADVIARLIAMLQLSVKFLLPNRADLVAPEDIRQSHIDLVRLPYPCVAFEAPWEGDTALVQRDGAFQEHTSTKRIALCWEPDPRFELLPGLYKILEHFPDGGVFVMPIYWVADTNSWNLPTGGSFFPYANKLERKRANDELPMPSQLARAALVQAGLATDKTAESIVEPFFILPEIFDIALGHLGGDRSKVFAQILLDSRDEVMALVKACSVINCANVGTATIDPMAAINKKRLVNGKQPFFSYKILQLTDERQEARMGGAGGHHASPRMHLRRGHLRQLETKVVWVRASMVNAGSPRGVVQKDYAVNTKWAAD